MTFAVGRIRKCTLDLKLLVILFCSPEVGLSYHVKCADRSAPPPNLRVSENRSIVHFEIERQFPLRDSLNSGWGFLALFGQAPPGALQLGLIMPNKVYGCIGHGPEMKPSKRYGHKSPVRGWFGREGKSSTWSASAIPGSCAHFLGRSSGGIERYQPCAHTHVITLS